MVAAEGRAAGFEANAESADASSVEMIPRAFIFADCCGLDGDDGSGCDFGTFKPNAAIDAEGAAAEGAVGWSTSMASPPSALFFTLLESFEDVAGATAAAEFILASPSVLGCFFWDEATVPPTSISFCFSSSLEELPSPARLDITFDAAVAFAGRSVADGGTASAVVGLLPLPSAASMIFYLFYPTKMLSRASIEI